MWRLNKTWYNRSLYVVTLATRALIDKSSKQILEKNIFANHFQRRFTMQTSHVISTTPRAEWTYHGCTIYKTGWLWISARLIFPDTMYYTMGYTDILAYSSRSRCPTQWWLVMNITLGCFNSTLLRCPVLLRDYVSQRWMSRIYKSLYVNNLALDTITKTEAETTTGFIFHETNPHKVE